MPEMNAEPVRFNFNERKAAAAAALLLKLDENVMPYMRLVKLLYIADRESLARWGKPITGDSFVSLDHGPVLSQTLDLCKYKSSRSWASQIEREGRWAVKLKSAPDLDALSDAEVALLEEVSKVYRDCDQWELSRITHKFPEWRDPKGSAIEILPIDLLRVVSGRSEQEIADLLEEVKARAHFDKIFSP